MYSTSVIHCRECTHIVSFIVTCLTDETLINQNWQHWWFESYCNCMIAGFFSGASLIMYTCKLSNIGIDIMRHYMFFLSFSRWFAKCYFLPRMPTTIEQTPIFCTQWEDWRILTNPIRFWSLCCISYNWFDNYVSYHPGNSYRIDQLLVPKTRALNMTRSLINHQYLS